jgi:hypothetical protein
MPCAVKLPTTQGHHASDAADDGVYACELFDSAHTCCMSMLLARRQVPENGRTTDM